MSVLRKNIVALSVLQGANYILPLITLPYLVRVLGPENFGRIAFAQAFIQYFVVAVNYSFDLSATRAVALAKDNPVELSRLFSSVMTIKIVIALLGFMLMAALVAIFPVFEHDWVLYCLMYLTVVGNVLFPVWLYQGLGHMRHITAFTIMARSLMVIAIFVFVTNSADYAIAAGLLSAGMLMAGLIALIFIPRLVKIRLCWPGFSQLMQDFLAGWHIFVAMMGGSVYNSSNIFILGLVASPAVVGYFAAADKLIKAVQGIIQPVSQAVYPHIATLIARSRDEALTFIGKLLRIIGGGMLGVSVALFLLAAPISEVLFGGKFDQSIHLIELMALVPFLIGLNNVFGAQFLVQFDLGRLLSFSIILPALVHVAVLYFIANNWGASGVALLMIFTETFVLGIRIIGLQGAHKQMLWHVLLARTPQTKNV